MAQTAKPVTIVAHILPRWKSRRVHSQNPEEVFDQ